MKKKLTLKYTPTQQTIVVNDDREKPKTLPQKKKNDQAVKKEKVIQQQKVKVRKLKPRIEPDLYVEVLAYFKQKYPLCFGELKLLKIGTRQELIEREKDCTFPKKTIQLFLDKYCREELYKMLRNTADINTKRYDLEGMEYPFLKSTEE